MRFAEEIEGYLVELGEDGRLIRLQLEELAAGVAEDPAAGGPGLRGRPRPGRGRRRPGRTAARVGAEERRPGPAGSPAGPGRAARPVGRRPARPGRVAAALGLGSDQLSLDAGVEARGYRLLHRLPRVSDVIIERIVDRFATLPRILQASLVDLEKVGGVGGAKARSVKDGLARMVEASILERYE